MTSRGKGRAENTPNREELFNLAVETAKNGNRQGARVMLMNILREDRKNIRAMMWMAKIASSRADREKWLNEVLRVNPNHEAALAALHKIQHGDSARRNRLLFRAATGGYVVAVLLVALLIILANVPA
ncbi:MAG: hypothetical protein MUE40_04315 [Anaerolineae bacterium]|jgi:uncharacterized membrane protein YdbT with pleckstrin-like domain|nr:hypothetical protein [Anaerolineae bacterium]